MDVKWNPSQSRWVSPRSLNVIVMIDIIIIIIIFRLYDDLIYPSAGSYSHSVHHFTVINSSLDLKEILLCFPLQTHNEGPIIPSFQVSLIKTLWETKGEGLPVGAHRCLQTCGNSTSATSCNNKAIRSSSQITNSMRQLSISRRPQMKQMRHPERTYDWW